MGDFAFRFGGKKAVWEGEAESSSRLEPPPVCAIQNTPREILCSRCVTKIARFPPPSRGFMGPRN